MSKKTETKKDETTAKGTWWLPEKPDNKLPGEIIYGPISGAKLQVFDYFFPNTYFNARPEPFVVWGETLKGVLITLFNCRASNVQAHFPGGRSAEIFSYFGIVGGHFQTPEEIRFIELSVNLTNLRAWSCMTGLIVKFDDPEKHFHLDQIIPAAINLGGSNLGSPTRFQQKLVFTSNVNPGFGNFQVQEECFLVLESSEMIIFEEFNKAIVHFLQFLTLATGRAAYALEMKGKIDKPKELIQERPIFQEYKIIGKLSSDASISETLAPHDMLFTLADMQPNPDIYYKNFLNKYKLLEPVCSLFLATVYAPRMFVQQQFLSLAHAVEAYHRAFIGGKYQTDDEYAKGIQMLLVKTIPEQTPKDFKDSLKNKFKYLHEYSLRKRLQDICAKFSNLVKPHIGDETAFANEVANQRNLLTHPDSTIESYDQDQDWKKLWLMSEQLSLLLEICLLSEIGFEGEKLAKVLENNQRITAIQLNR